MNAITAIINVFCIAFILAWFRLQLSVVRQICLSWPKVAVVLRNVVEDLHMIAVNTIPSRSLRYIHSLAAELPRNTALTAYVGKLALLPEVRKSVDTVNQSF